MEGVSFGDSSTLLSLGSRTAKPHCAVYSWIVFDVAEGANALSVSSEGDIHSATASIDDGACVKPLVLFSHYVEFHSAGRFDRGDSIRSGYAISYDGRGIFETQDTIYVLFGKGFRRRAAREAISALPEGVIDVDYSQVGSRASLSGVAALNAASQSVYCDLKMSVAQGQNMLDLVRGLRKSGQHVGLDSVLRDIEQEITTSLTSTPHGGH